MTTCYVITDSYGVHNGADSYPYIMAAKLGWTLTVDAIPGSRWTGSAAGQNFGDRIGAAIAANPDVVMVVGSVNDRIASAAVTTAAVMAGLSTLKAAVPRVIAAIFNGSDALGYAGLRWGAVAIAAARDAVQAGAIAAGVEFIDGIGLIHGTGTTAAPNGDGNADAFVEPDGVHHSADGAACIGFFLARRISPPSTGLRGL
jgi:hypothetical protein